MDQSRPLLFFPFISHSKYQIEFQFQQFKLKIVDGMFGIWTCVFKMVGADKTTELMQSSA